MNKNNRKNGVTPNKEEKVEEMRQAVIEQELSARSWKAYYEKMYYSMEAEKIEPAYREYQDRTTKRVAEERKKMEEFLKTLNEEVIPEKNESDPAGEIKLQVVEEPNLTGGQ